MIYIMTELRDALPKLSTEEYEDLTQLLISEGLRESIILWGNYILDGHNRYEICTKHNIPIRTVQHNKNFDTVEEAVDWIYKNQNARRNLTEGQKLELAIAKGTFYANKAKQNQATSTGGANPQLKPKLAQAKPILTNSEIAKETSYEKETIRKAKIVFTEGSEELKQAVRDDKIKISKAFNEVRPSTLKPPVQKQPDPSPAIIVETVVAPIDNSKELALQSELQELQSKYNKLADKYEELYKKTTRDLADTGKRIDRIFTTPLASEIVNAGFKTLVMKYHPDYGGKNETFTELKQTREDMLIYKRPSNI